MFAEGRARKARLGHRVDLDAVVIGAEHPLLTSPAEQGPQRNRPRQLQISPLLWLQTYLYALCKLTSEHAGLRRNCRESARRRAARWTAEVRHGGVHPSRAIGVRVVLDTSVFVPGVFFRGPPRDVLAAWRDGRIKVVVSREIIREYVRVGERLSARFPAADLEHALDMVTASATLVSAPPLPEPVCEDRDDDKFLACAVAGGARYVVSGDRALLATSPYQNVIVIRSRDFMDMLAED